MPQSFGIDAEPARTNRRVLQNTNRPPRGRAGREHAPSKHTIVIADMSRGTRSSGRVPHGEVDLARRRPGRPPRSYRRSFGPGSARPAGAVLPDGPTGAAEPSVRGRAYPSRG